MSSEPAECAVHPPPRAAAAPSFGPSAGGEDETFTWARGATCRLLGRVYSGGRSVSRQNTWLGTCGIWVRISVPSRGDFVVVFDVATMRDKIFDEL